VLRDAGQVETGVAGHDQRCRCALASPPSAKSWFVGRNFPRGEGSASDPLLPT
jgi:hypothetical protein